jgi:hypothetical protein
LRDDGLIWDPLLLPRIQYQRLEAIKPENVLKGVRWKVLELKAWSATAKTGIWELPAHESTS